MSILTAVKWKPTSADNLVEVEQQLLPGDHHMLHLSEQVWVKAGRVDVDRGHQ